MIQLNLTDEERNMLMEILENNLSDLRMEIAHTDRLDFRNTLKDKKHVLEKTLVSLDKMNLKSKR